MFMRKGSVKFLDALFSDVALKLLCSCNAVKCGFIVVHIFLKVLLQKRGANL